VEADRARPLTRARVAVAVLFFTNGVLFANVVPRYPELKDSLGLGNAGFGAVLAAFPAGSLAVGLLAARAVGRWSSARVAAWGIGLLSAAFALVGLTPPWPVLAAVLFVGGGLDALIDVAQNAHGLRVQRAYGRSIVNAFHGVWSIGAVTGGLMGSAAAGWSVGLAPHLLGAGVLATGAALGAYRFLLPGADHEVEAGVAAAGPGPASRRRRWPRALLVLGLLAVCGAVVEDAGASWGALYLRGAAGAGAAVAGLAFVALQVAMTVGRLGGDRLVDRWGTVAVARLGGIAVAAGMGVAVAVPWVGVVLAGYAVAGLGVATLVPSAMHAADELPGLRPGVGLTVVSWTLRVGFLASPPIVGALADAVSLRVGLLLAVAAGAAVAGLARVGLDHG
jgi:MFS family permease